MKSNRRFVIFAVVFGVVAGMVPQVGFSKSTDNRTEIKAKALTNGTEKHFVSYVKEELRSFSKKDSWGIIEKMVTLYGEKPSKLMNVPSSERVAFIQAVEKLNSKLERKNSVEATQWNQSLIKTSNAIQFVWNFNFDNLTPVISEELPVLAQN